MTDLGFILAGWGVALGSMALYAVRLVLRGRALSAEVEPARRRWMNADD